MAKDSIVKLTVVLSNTVNADSREEAIEWVKENIYQDHGRRNYVSRGGVTMTKQEFDDLYLGKAVHCNTEEKANKFLKLAHGFGWNWCSGRSLLEENSYHNYQEKTCYSVARYGFACSPEDFYIENGYEVVKFKQEKENKMKYKVGDKVRVRSDLVVDNKYGGCRFAHEMAKFKGNVVTITSVLEKLNNYRIEEFSFYWTDEMLEPVETFNVGDVVYDEGGQHLEVIGFGVKVRTKNRVEFYKPHEVLSKTKPLKKITREELAKMGYELVD